MLNWFTVANFNSCVLLRRKALMLRVYKRFLTLSPSKRLEGTKYKTKKNLKNISNGKKDF